MASQSGDAADADAAKRDFADLACALAESVFVPMYYSSTYTIPGSGESDRDGDGYPDSEDNYPDDPNQH